ncbi:MAG: hypothetical protein KF781_02830 [Chitinophagaceae bacterium]|nr:hypothetical protein [Chitinophagaceae bacterium]MCW5904445.1 hypothetical protein [Chitinophagaceae bacterium]
MISLLIFSIKASAQCSVCTKTAEQLGEGPASALNSAIVYLMFSPLIIIAIVGYWWWKREKAIMKEEGSAD